MSPDLRLKIQLEINKLHQLLDRHAIFIKEAADATPQLLEIAGAGALVHSFYSGIERIFVLISRHCDHKIFSGWKSHVELLDAMAQSNSKRSAVLSPATFETLKFYQTFRHRFRHAYEFELKWSKMVPLITHMPILFEALEQEVDLFLETIG